MASNAVIVVAVLVIAAGVGGLGFVAGYEYRGSPANTPAAVTDSTLSILGAGTLNALFPELAGLLVNETPGISSPSAAQTYEGSLDVTTAIASLGAVADVAAVADYRIIPETLEPAHAGYEVVFGATPEVLVYNPSIAAFSGINTTNWAEKLVMDVTYARQRPLGRLERVDRPERVQRDLQPRAPGAPLQRERQHVLPRVLHRRRRHPRRAELADDPHREGVAGGDVDPYGRRLGRDHLPVVRGREPPVVRRAQPDRRARREQLRRARRLRPTVDHDRLVERRVRDRRSPPRCCSPSRSRSNAPNPTLGAAFIHLLLSPAGGRDPRPGRRVHADLPRMVGPPVVGASAPGPRRSDDAGVGERPPDVSGGIGGGRTVPSTRRWTDRPLLARAPARALRLAAPPLPAADRGAVHLRAGRGHRGSGRKLRGPGRALADVLRVGDRRPRGGRLRDPDGLPPRAALVPGPHDRRVARRAPRRRSAPARRPRPLPIDRPRARRSSGSPKRSGSRSTTRSGGSSS